MARLPAPYAALAALVTATSLPGCGGPPSGPAHAMDTVFVLPGSHLDIGFTAPISEVRDRRIQVLDGAIAAAQRDSNFIWFEEGGWTVEAWLDRYHDQPGRIAALRALVMRGQIGVGATLLSPYAAAFPDGLRLLTLHLDRVERELGVRPTVAVINDVPALPEAVVDALAAAGIKYLLGAPNLTFSPPLPAALVRQPFYWLSSQGARLLVYLDSDGYGSASATWGLPPECASAMNPGRFPPALGRDSIITRGIRDGLFRRGSNLPLMIVQDAYDNWDIQCAQLLPEAVARANSDQTDARMVLAMPDRFFQHVEQRFAAELPVHRGEWGGDWDLLRATEPVWSWRLRQAIRAVNDSTPRDVRLALVMAMDHNVGLGPRWMDGMPIAMARQHVLEVAALYRNAVSGVLGEAAVGAIPAPLTRIASTDWPSGWQTIVGERSTATRVRAGGPGFLHPLIDDSASVVAVPIEVAATDERMVIGVTLDRATLEAKEGHRRFSVVLELRIDRPLEQLAIAPENSTAAIAGQWLLGAPPATIISPDGVRVRGADFSFRASGPLIVGWNLARDPTDPGRSWLQALAFIDALEGITQTGPWRRPFAEMYPGEPSQVRYELEFERLSPP